MYVFVMNIYFCLQIFPHHSPCTAWIVCRARGCHASEDLARQQQMVQRVRLPAAFEHLLVAIAPISPHQPRIGPGEWDSEARLARRERAG